jgi:putative transcriptional regulator
MTPEGIKEARRKTGLNTKEFGALLGVSGRTVENWEQGHRNPSGPAVKMMEQLRRDHANRAAENKNC